jgi:hypothetical protein
MKTELLDHTGHILDIQQTYKMAWFPNICMRAESSTNQHCPGVLEEFYLLVYLRSVQLLLPFEKFIFSPRHRVTQILLEDSSLGLGTRMSNIWD